MFLYFQALWFDFILPTTETVPDVSGSLDIEGKIILSEIFALQTLFAPLAYTCVIIVQTVKI